MSVFEEKTDMRLDWVEDINQVVEELDAALMVVANLKTENAQLKSENEMLRKMIAPQPRLPGLHELRKKREGL